MFSLMILLVMIRQAASSTHEMSVDSPLSKLASVWLKSSPNDSLESLEIVCSRIWFSYLNLRSKKFCKEERLVYVFSMSYLLTLN